MKNEIIRKFNENVRGKKPDISRFNGAHDGKHGHWLEQQFGIAANGDNAPDIYGYELKNETTSGKTTFGDWSADYYIYKDKAYSDLFPGKTILEKRKNFYKYFGKLNIDKDRFSWSGEPVPSCIGQFNSYGQKMEIYNDKDIRIIYSYQHDQRANKNSIIPSEFKKGTIDIVKWSGDKLKVKLERKFNQKGWFTCKTNEKGEYDKICFGKPFTYDEWLQLLIRGIVFFDSGMFDGNARPYSQWRAKNNYWDSLIYETH